MTNEEKAVIQAARAYMDDSNPAHSIDVLADAVAALDAAPVPTRHFWLSYVINTPCGSGYGAMPASIQGPVTTNVLAAWRQGLEALPTNRAQHAQVIIQTWTELEA